LGRSKQTAALPNLKARIPSSIGGGERGKEVNEGEERGRGARALEPLYSYIYLGPVLARFRLGKEKEEKERLRISSCPKLISLSDFLIIEEGGGAKKKEGSGKFSGRRRDAYLISCGLF